MKSWGVTEGLQLGLGLGLLQLPPAVLYAAQGLYA